MTNFINSAFEAERSELEGCSRRARRPFPSQLLAGWLLVGSSVAFGWLLRGVMAGNAWVHLWAVLFFFTSKAATLLRLAPPAWRRLTWGRLLAYLFWIETCAPVAVP